MMGISRKKGISVVALAVIVGLVFTIISIISVDAKSVTGKVTVKVAGKGTHGAYYKNASIYSDGKMHYYIVKGKLGFCLDPESRILRDQAYTRVKGTNVKGYGKTHKMWLQKVLMHAYGSSVPPPYGNTADKYAASQVVIWQLYKKLIGNGSSTLGKKSSGSLYKMISGSSNAKKNYNWIINTVNKHMKGPSFKGMNYDMTGSVTKTITDNNSYQKYTVKSKTNLDSVSITKGSDGKYRYTVTKSSGKQGKLVLQDSRTNKSGTWYIWKKGSYQTLSMTQPVDTTTYSVTFSGTVDPELKIRKTDAETGETVRMAGFEFQIKKKSDGSFWQDEKGNTTFVTNAEGIASVGAFTECQKGEWQVIETAVPEISTEEDENGTIRYLLNETPVDVPAVGAGGAQEVVVAFANYPEPDLETKAYDSVTSSHIGVAREKCEIIDMVSMRSLVRGRTYQIDGEILDKKTGKRIEGEGSTASVKFTLPEESGDIKDESGSVIGKVTFAEGEPSEAVIYMKYTFDASSLQGGTVVAAETLLPEEGEPVVHRDLEDEEQTINFPKLVTRAFSLATGKNMGVPSEKEDLKDIIDFENLVAGREYDVTSKIVDKASGDVLFEQTSKVSVKRDGTADEESTEEEASSEGQESETSEDDDDTNQAPEDETADDGDMPLPEDQKQYFVSGTFEITFEDFDSSKLEGKEVVIYEEIKYGDTTLAEHKDINDEDQTIFYGKIRTEARQESGETVTVTDKVVFENLIPGEEYTLKGELMTEDGESSGITSSIKFTPQAASGYTEIEFEVDRDEWAGKKLVAFETLTLDGNTVAEHKDIESKMQTVRIENPDTPSTGERTGKIVLTILLMTAAGYALILSGDKKKKDFR